MSAEAQVDEGPKKWSKAADEKLRKMFLAEARQKCEDQVKSFVECSKEHGLMVILKCRKENSAMNDCTRQHTSMEKFEEFRRTKIEEYVREGKVKIDKDSARVGPPK